MFIKELWIFGTVERCRSLNFEDLAEVVLEVEPQVASHRCFQAEPPANALKRAMHFKLRDHLTHDENLFGSCASGIRNLPRSQYRRVCGSTQRLLFQLGKHGRVQSVVPRDLGQVKPLHLHAQGSVGAVDELQPRELSLLRFEQRVPDSAAASASLKH